MSSKLYRIVAHPATFQGLVVIASAAAGAAVGMVLGDIKNERDATPVVVVEAEPEVTDPTLPFGEVIQSFETDQSDLSVEMTLDSEAFINKVLETSGDIPITQIVLPEPEDEDADGESEDPEEAALGEEPPEPEHSPEVVQNIWDDQVPDWDFQKEVAGRLDNAPYVIHVKEFEADEFGYTQESVVFYEGDDVLCDSNNVVVYDFATVLGDLQFGHGSGDPNVVYIRNPERQAEYEVIRDERHYTVAVLGMDQDEAESARESHVSHGRRTRLVD